MANMADNPLPIGHELTEGTVHHALTVYGSETCGDTRRARALLDSLDIEYNYYDVDKDPSMARTMSALQNGGQKMPAIDFHDGMVLVEPTNDALVEALQKTDRLPHVAPVQV